MFEYQRTQAWIESVKTTVTNAKTRFAVTVTHDNIEVTVTVEDKKNLETSLDLNNIKQLVSDYITTTDNADFDSVINTIYLTVAQHYPKRDIEVLIYDNVECLSIMKIFNQPAI
jgi:hypothetical protein